MSEASTRVTALFMDLVDAVRYSQNWSETVERQAEAKKDLQRQLEAIDELQARTSSLFETKRLDPDVAVPMGKAVTDFVSAAAEQARKRISEKLRVNIDELSAEANSLKVKATKSLESFLATTPLPVLDEEIGLDLSGGSYATYASYKCSDEIDYEFLLNTANSRLFKSDLAASALWKGTKLPVRLSKAWLKKEPVPDFEKLDNYVLVGARASRNHLSATLTNQETAASASLVFSRSNNDSFVTVEYSDKSGKADVTGEPSLNRHLDLMSVKRIMGALLDAIIELDREKLRLVKLRSGQDDVLASLGCSGFMQRVVGVFSQSTEEMQAIRTLDPGMTRDRLKLLGEGGKAVSSSLGLDVLGAKPDPTTPS